MSLPFVQVESWTMVESSSNFANSGSSEVFTLVNSRPLASALILPEGSKPHRKKLLPIEDYWIGKIKEVRISNNGVSPLLP